MPEIKYKLKVLKNYIQRNWSFYRGKTKLNFFPLILLVEITNHCNLRCQICPNRIMKRKKGFMSLDLFKKIINDIKGKVSWVLLILGGEPLLHKQLPEMIKFAKENGVRCDIYTNAALLDKETSKKLINSGLDRITISFDGEDAEYFEKIRTGAKYSKVLQNIIYFLDLKRKMKSKKPYVIIQVVKLFGHHKNLQLKKDFTEIFKKYNIFKYNIFFAHSWAGKIKNRTVPRKKNNYIHCDDLWYKMAVTWDGKIVPCCLDLNTDFVIADANKVPTLSAWNSKSLITLRDKLVKGKFRDIHLCRNCDRLWEEKRKIDELYFKVYRFFKPVNKILKK